ncbi:hypothetical protein AB2L27_08760 [Kineococcus sp. LSe6-4]|uniref:WXG100 family type VII secretion target n=1 Tax=Kineococcus halophytocola TaxID=3234027 RepID=A0ABV4H340_9ACTN
MDPGQAHVDTLARRLAAEADDVRAGRRRLLACGDVAWSGAAAAGFRTQLEHTGERVDRLARTVEDAAGSLRAHSAAMAAMAAAAMAAPAGGPA